ncbi:chloride channel E, partial [Striga asiatica]
MIAMKLLSLKETIAMTVYKECDVGVRGSGPVEGRGLRGRKSVIKCATEDGLMEVGIWGINGEVKLVFVVLLPLVLQSCAVIVDENNRLMCCNSWNNFSSIGKSHSGAWTATPNMSLLTARTLMNDVADGDHGGCPLGLLDRESIYLAR